ncbi:D-alanine--poly(phosphoribitol) ligase, partial [Campylobacter jejuni]
KDKLPSYMIPKNFIKIDKFKLNQNGKIDRNYYKEL